MFGTLLEVALNGAVTKSVNPNVPRSPWEITRDALACIKAGASIVHNHNDESVINGPEIHDWAPYAQAWRPILIREPNAILYPTMSGWSPGSTIEQRYQHVVRLAQEGLLGMPVIDLGGFNVGRIGLDGSPEPTDDMYVNTYKDLDYMFRKCQTIGLPISLAVFEPGHLRAGLAYEKAGWIPPGSLIKLFFNSAPIDTPSRGLPPIQAGLEAYLEMLSGTDLSWMAVVTGQAEVAEEFYMEVLAHGGHLSVGIERAGRSGTPNNVDLVNKAAQLCEASGRPALSCGEARQVVGLGKRE